MNLIKIDYIYINFHYFYFNSIYNDRVKYYILLYKYVYI